MNKFGRSLPSPYRVPRVLPAPTILSFTRDGDYNFREHKLCNVSPPTDDTDGVNKKFLDDAISVIYMKIIASSNECVKLVNDTTNSIEGRMKAVSAELRDLNDRLLKSSTSISRITRDISTINDRFNAIDVKLKLVDNYQQEAMKIVQPEFDKLEDLLHSYMHVKIENSFAPLAADLKKLDEKVTKLADTVDRGI